MWGTYQISRQIVSQLIGYTVPKTLAALPNRREGWRVIPTLFARTGATAQAVLREHNGVHVDLPTLYDHLGERSDKPCGC
jgi:hypothetical protein